MCVCVCVCACACVCVCVHIQRIIRPMYNFCVWCKHTHTYVYAGMCECAFLPHKLFMISCTNIYNYVKLDIHNFANADYKICQGNASHVAAAVYNMLMREFLVFG